MTAGVEPLDARDEAMLGPLVEAIETTLDDVQGIVLHGSAVLGSLRPTSDLDLLAVVTHPVEHRRKLLLVERVMRLSGDGERLRGAELTVVAVPDVRPWRYPAVRDLQYGEWLRAGLESGDESSLRRVVDPDLALILSVARTHGRALTGPPPAQLLDPVPSRDVVRATRACVPEVLASLDDDTRNGVLTLARAWATVATGDIVPKDTAADWAASRLGPPHDAVIRHARDLYLAGTYAWADGPRGIGECADELARRIGNEPA